MPANARSLKYLSFVATIGLCPARENSSVSRGKFRTSSGVRSARPTWRWLSEIPVFSLSDPTNRGRGARLAQAFFGAEGEVLDRDVASMFEVDGKELWRLVH